MKRHKRDRSERAYSNGFQSGIKGHSQDFCPYEEAIPREVWLTGWREGWELHKKGNSSYV